MITAIEELSLNAWPALQTIFYDGWVLRFANGYTRRANSINPLYASHLDLDEKLEYCEQVYRQQKQDVVFKITAASRPENLDETLAHRGYRKDAATSVQTLALDAAQAGVDHGAVLQETLQEDWLEAYCQLSNVAGARRDTLRGILLNIVPQHCYFAITAENIVVACGLGVLQAGQVGLFDIVTGEAFRSRGYGQKIVQSILGWGRENGARSAYLQVMLNNAPALRLYARTGFVEAYQYWYRIKA